ncbi:DUF6274 family protein [Streptomyces sp. NBC_00237]|uniref:DUF6274 family protein n=1 Tax=Streptomyces sp. NBC_00237 TaxID=2975687 RepID=UPI002254DE2E|nr:DUF6274 family protein [Streptomyces sp. NBC_00237]MCX5199884.1 DUF6274 family protein [Streptomyces sp. NBC_00237]
MAASKEKHETRALLRAHLAAATRYRHRTGNCPICLRLLRLAIAEQIVEQFDEEAEEEAGEKKKEKARDESPPIP